MSSLLDFLQYTLNLSCDNYVRLESSDIELIPHMRGETNENEINIMSLI